MPRTGPSFPSAASPFVCLPAALALLVPLVPAQGDAAANAFRDRQLRREAVRDPKLLAGIASGIAWLKGHQDEDGRFAAKDFAKHDPANARCDGEGNGVYDVGVTGIALLAMLAQGDHAHDEACGFATDWLVRQFDPKTGRVNAATHDFVYNQAIATLALCEAALLLGSQRHRDAAARAIGHLEQHRNPGAAWRYQPRDGDNDSSITSWCLAAYATAHELGLDVPAKSVGEALAWLDSATDFDTGMTGYVKPGERSARQPGDHSTKFPVELGEALSAAGLHTRLLWGMLPSDPFAQAAAARLAGKAPAWDAPAIDFYYWLHGSVAMALMQGGAEQKRWQLALHKALLPSQRKDGAAAGSWDAVGAWCHIGGRVCSTASAVLALSSGFRHGRMDVLADVPTGPTFRRVQDALEDQKLGAAAAALAAIDVASLPPDAQAAHRRFDYWLQIEVARATQVLASLEQRFPDLLGKMQRLDAIATAMAGLPLAQVAADRLAQLEKDPKAKAELKAAKELRELQSAFAQVLQSRNKTRKKKLADQLTRFMEKNQGTAAAERARGMLQQLQ